MPAPDENGIGARLPAALLHAGQREAILVEHLWSRRVYHIAGLGKHDGYVGT